jgi:DtxR family Mn-dependent transcriptional regulator
MEDYLKEIYRLEQANRSARVSDISREMGVRKASVVSAVNLLRKHELLTQEPYGHINLTESGRTAAEITIKKYDIIYNFLTDTLKTDGDTAKKEACTIEHCLSEGTVSSLAMLVKNPGRNTAGKKKKKPAGKKSRS